MSLYRQASSNDFISKGFSPFTSAPSSIAQQASVTPSSISLAARGNNGLISSLSFGWLEHVIHVHPDFPNPNPELLPNVV